MLDEYVRWSERRAQTGVEQSCGHGCAQPRYVTGVPDGWTMVAHLCAPERTCCYTLTHRDDGAWGLIQTADTYERTNLMRATAGLDDLYASVRFVPAPAGWKNGVRVVERSATRRLGGPFPLLTDWLAHDPVDEAHLRMLFALSGDLRRLPEATP